MTVVRVTSASEAAALDAATIDRGVPSRALMQRAGAAAAAQISTRYGDQLRHGAVVYAGEGNNGGDAWVVAAALSKIGVAVQVIESGEARTEDACFERALALPLVHRTANGSLAPASVLIDGLLGTGARGAPRARTAELIRELRAARERGAAVVALDVPSGVDGTTGDAHDPHVIADITLTFGTLKRGLLRARDAAGTIVVLDIGLVETDGQKSSILATSGWVAGHVPTFGADAHKGVRRKVAIVGGRRGMAGAVSLAARSALRSGVGMVRALVAPESLQALQASVSEALADDWPAGEGARATVQELVCDWADAVLLGPGLGSGRAARELVETTLDVWGGPVVLDADALNVFAGDARALDVLLGGRPAIITPHLMEFVRLSGRSRTEVNDRHFEIGSELAAALNCAVLLKGVPTVVSAPDGETFVSAAGSPVLATAGSGDVLAGIAITLLAQMDVPAHAAACAAWIHGRAAEQAATGHGTRGVTLGDVLEALGQAWPIVSPATPPYPILAELPAAAPR